MAATGKLGFIQPSQFVKVNQKQGGWFPQRESQATAVADFFYTPDTLTVTKATQLAHREWRQKFNAMALIPVHSAGQAVG